MLKNLKLLSVAFMIAAVPATATAQYASAGSEFLKAIKERDGSKVMELLDAQGSTVVNYRDDKGQAALHIVAASRDHSYLAYLLGKGADPNVQDRSGDTPLIAAARIGDADGAAILLARRAKVDLANRAGETPLIVAVQQRQAEMAKLLLEAGANPDRTDNASGRSARDYAKLDRRNAELLKIIETTKPAKSTAVAGPKL